MLFQYQLATQAQILELWPLISPEKDIGQLLVEKGVITQATYDQLAEHMVKAAATAAPKVSPIGSFSPKSNASSQAAAALAHQNQNPSPKPNSNPSSNSTSEPTPKSSPTPSSTPVSNSPSSSPPTTKLSPNPKPPSNIQVKDPGRFEPNQNLHEMLAHARAKGFTDLHLSAGNAIHVRQGGHLHPESASKLTKEAMQGLVKEALADDWPDFESKGDLETVIDLGSLGRFRVAALRQRSGLDLTVRLIPQVIRNFEQSELPESCRELCHWAQGLVLVTGPAGCGKTSTLATLVQLVNESRHDHIITIEDPIEIAYQPTGCQITQRQIGRHTQSREAALKAALREDPDIIVISELRDLDTIKLAVSAAETGHLVFGTMNTINATRTIYRLIDSFPPEEQGIIRNMVSESLRGVISQQLLPRKDGTGVVPAYEVLMVNSAVSNMIRKDEAHQLGTAMITGKGSGMVVLDDSLRKLVDTGLVEPEEAWSRASNPKDFEKYLSKR